MFLGVSALLSSLSSQSLGFFLRDCRIWVLKHIHTHLTNAPTRGMVAFTPCFTVIHLNFAIGLLWYCPMCRQSKIAGDTGVSHSYLTILPLYRYEQRRCWYLLRTCGDLVVPRQDHSTDKQADDQTHSSCAHADPTNLIELWSCCLALVVMH